MPRTRASAVEAVLQHSSESTSIQRTSTDMAEESDTREGSPSPECASGAEWLTPERLQQMMMEAIRAVQSSHVPDASDDRAGTSATGTLALHSPEWGGAVRGSQAAGGHCPSCARPLGGLGSVQPWEAGINDDP